MNLEEFRRTRVVMTPELFINIYNPDGGLGNDTARVHVYKDGLYIRELLNGCYSTDMDSTCNKMVRERKVVEFHFWNNFAELTYNPKPRLNPMLYDALMSFKVATGNLSETWIQSDDDKTNELLGIDMPLDISFDEFNSAVHDWVDNLLDE